MRATLDYCTNIISVLFENIVQIFNLTRDSDEANRQPGLNISNNSLEGPGSQPPYKIPRLGR